MALFPDFYYQFQLKGEHESLLRASARFDRGKDIAFVLHDDGVGEPHYYFSSIHLANLTNSNDVWDRGTQLLSLYGIAHELYESTSPYALLHTASLDLEYLFKGDSVVRLSKPASFQLYNIGPFDTSIMPEDSRNSAPYGNLLFLARTNEQAYEVLLQMGRANTMSQYYIVFETIKTQMGDAFAKMLTSKKLYNTYVAHQSTVNNYSIGKENARHGQSSKDGNKAKPAAISLKESRELALNICRGYFSIMHNINFPPVQESRPEDSMLFADDDF